MNTLPKLPKILSILCILLLIVPFVLGGAAVATRYVDFLLPIAFLVVIGFGVVFYYIGKRKRLAS